MSTTTDNVLPYRDFGYENGWQSVPEPIAYCRAKGHLTIERNQDASLRGRDHLVTCHACRIVYHYDSSD